MHASKIAVALAQLKDRTNDYEGQPAKAKFLVTLGLPHSSCTHRLAKSHVEAH
jgi:hypothetical protein